MGFFSWITQDTDRSITNIHSGEGTFPVFMQDNKGGIWTEINYDGYGIFGGKDFYELVAEMNGHIPNRDIGIKIYFGISGIMHRDTNDILLGQGINFFNWQDTKILNDKSANELLELPEWDNIRVQYDRAIFPCISEYIDYKWKQYERPEDCPNQGFFL
jgi:hypothetical protein